MIDRQLFYGIIGLGKTGQSCARFLTSQKARFEILDDRTSPPDLEDFQKKFPETPVHLGPFTLEQLQSYDALIVSPGISVQQPIFREVVQSGRSVIGDIELFALIANAPVIAITGSNAKGTVTTLVGLMAEKSGYNVRVGGNIGTPALDIWSKTPPDLYVLEISSFQLETTYSLSSRAATILNFCEDHLDRYDGRMSDYIQAKQRIYSGCEYPIYNRDDPRTSPRRFSNRPMISFGLDEPGAGDYGIRQRDGQHWLVRGAEHLMATRELSLKGTHQWANALAALALGHCMEFPLSAMLEVLREFKGLPHRCEWLGRHQALDWFDDSKATNVGAALAAIEGLGRSITPPQKIVLIAGGQSKGADLTPLRDPIARFVRHVVLLGQDAPLLAHLLEGVVPYSVVSSLAEAVSCSRQKAHANDTILLSPACASLDMFKDYVDRGVQFAALARQQDDSSP